MAAWMMMTRFASCLLFSVAIVRVTEGAGVVKRSDDFAGMAVVEQLAGRVTTLEASLAAMQTSLSSTRTTVDRMDTVFAFATSLKATTVSYRAGMTVKFDDVILNNGGGYDAMTGVFTVPVSGTYIFFVKIQTYAGKSQSLNLQHNSHRAGQVYADDATSYDMASTQEVMHATKGDTFWVESGYDAEFRGSGVTRFSGFLVNAD